MIPQSSAPSGLQFRIETPSDDSAVEALLQHAFGPGRFTKVSERVREFAEFRPRLSYTAWEGDRLVGSVRMWRVRIGETPAIFLGPLAVEADQRKHGLGGELVRLACEAAEKAGLPLVLLVGDEPYFQRFGFSAAMTQGVRLPGPVDPRRVLSRGAAGPLSGPVQA